jgi:hypothetical protein
MLPRFRMDRAVPGVLSGVGAGRPVRAAARSRRELSRRAPLIGRGLPLSRREWAQARHILEPLSAADPRAATFLLARTEFESGHPDVATAMLDDFLARRPRQPARRAARADPTERR